MAKFALLASVAPLAFDTGAYLPTAEDVAAARRGQRHMGLRGSGDAMLQRSPDIASMVEYWDQTTSIVDGIKAMRERGEDYLPRFTGEDQEEYTARLKLTKMTNVYRDIVESLAAKPFEREVCLPGDEEGLMPPALDAFEDDVDGAGNSLTSFANAVFYNGINSAIDWIYVDFPKADASVVTLADYKARGYRPYWSRVLAINVLAAQSKMIGGVETLVYIKVFEPGKPNHVREFERLDTGVIVWRLYRDTGAKDEKTKTAYVEVESGTLSIPSIPMIPFYTGRRDGRTWRLFPAMQDAADLQIELYQQESGLKFAKNLTAYPMLSANGVNPPRDNEGNLMKVRVGPNRILYAPPDGAGNSGSWSYVEPSSESLKFLAADITDTIKELRELGRQPLTVASQNLTKETTQVAAGKAKSAIKQWAIGLQNALEKALVLTCLYLQIPTEEYKPSVDVYTDFDEFFDDKSLDSLAKDRDRGDLSRRSYWIEMRRRGVYRPDFDMVEETKQIEAERLAAVPSDGIDTQDTPPMDNPGSTGNSEED